MFACARAYFSEELPVLYDGVEGVGLPLLQGRGADGGEVGHHPSAFVADEEDLGEDVGAVVVVVVVLLLLLLLLLLIQTFTI